MRRCAADWLLCNVVEMAHGSTASQLCSSSAVAAVAYAAPPWKMVWKSLRKLRHCDLNCCFVRCSATWRCLSDICRFSGI